MRSFDKNDRKCVIVFYGSFPGNVIFHAFYPAAECNIDNEPSTIVTLKLPNEENEYVQQKDNPGKKSKIRTSLILGK